jgi:hypothetical protein
MNPIINFFFSHLLHSFDVKGLTIDQKAIRLLDINLVKPLTLIIIILHHAFEYDIHGGPLYGH